MGVRISVAAEFSCAMHHALLADLTFKQFVSWRILNDALSIMSNRARDSMPTGLLHKEGPRAQAGHADVDPTAVSIHYGVSLQAVI